MGGRESVLAVSLVKLIAGKPSIIDSLPNGATVNCQLCEQTYRLGYSDSEWNRIKDWLGIAERAVRADHKYKHEVLALGLAWRQSRKH